MTDTPNPVDVHVGQRIRVARRLIDMSQEQLASHLGLTFQQVQKYERGANRISASKLHQASAALGQTHGWFFEGLPGSAEASPQADEAAATLQAFSALSCALRIARVVLNLSPRQQTALVDYLESSARPET